MSIHHLTPELVLEIIRHLHPHDILALAPTCKFFRLHLTPQSLSFGFAKKHLALLARLTLEKLSEEPWDGKWLHDLDCRAPVRYEEPLLFNYGVAAVVLHGFSFTYPRHLGRLMLKDGWQREDGSCKDVDKRRRLNWVKVLDAACRMDLISVNTLPTLTRSPAHLYYDLKREVQNAFLAAALGESMDLLRAIVAKYPMETFTGEEDLAFSFQVAARFRSVELFSLILSILSNENLEDMSVPVARRLINVCIDSDFPDPIALLPADHPSLFLAGTSSLTLKAVSQNRPEILGLLLQKGAKLSADLLAETISSLHPSEPDEKLTMVRHLLAIGANPNALHDDETALHIASRRGASRTMTLLIEAGADVNAAGRYNRTPLQVACQMARVHVVRRLLEAGADVEAVDARGWTPLHDATWGRNVETVKVLLDAGACVNVGDKLGQTPLYVACQEGSLGLVELLLGAGADANAVDEQGMSPLHVTCDHLRSMDIMKLLLDAGADVNKVDVDGRTALDVARGRNHFRALEVLVRARGPLSRAKGKSRAE
ncbi:hypothetical protein HDU96_006657 [Phlyctochytrium bullatum]|nr:hypothetical protein HDU96_006657 [Phlyctochytrium bullatum]